MTGDAECFRGNTAVRSLRRNLGDDADNPTTSSPSRASDTEWRRVMRRDKGGVTKLKAGDGDNAALQTQGDAGGTHRRAHRHRVPDAGRAFGQRRAAADPPASAATGLGTGQGRGLRAGAGTSSGGCAASWATTRTTPATSSPSPASVTAWSLGEGPERSESSEVS